MGGIQVIDDYFQEGGGGGGDDLDAIEQAMLAALATEDTDLFAGASSASPKGKSRSKRTPKSPGSRSRSSKTGGGGARKKRSGSVTPPPGSSPPSLSRSPFAARLSALGSSGVRASLSSSWSAGNRASDVRLSESGEVRVSDVRLSESGELLIPKGGACRKGARNDGVVSPGARGSGHGPVQHVQHAPHVFETTLPGVTPPPTTHVFGGGGGGGGGGRGTNASWSAGMGAQQHQQTFQLRQMQMFQLQQAAAMVAGQRNGGNLARGMLMFPGGTPGGGGSASSSWSSTGQGGGGGQSLRVASALERIRRAGVDLTAGQEGLVNTILDRGDPFLTSQFTDAVVGAEKGDATRLHELLKLAQSLSSSMQAAGLTPPPPPLQPAAVAIPVPRAPAAEPSPLVPFPVSPALPPALMPHSLPPPVAHVPVAALPPDDPAPAAAASAALASGDRAALEDSLPALEALVLSRRTRAVDLRDLGRFEEALQAMRLLKEAIALLAACTEARNDMAGMI